ncbi:MAG: peroxiredoxin [archaeon]
MKSRRKIDKLKKPRASPKYKQILGRGEQAPDFALWGTDGKSHSLSEFKGKNVALYFYPKDNTPGCTSEACSFRDIFPELKKKKAVVIGISPDNVRSHEDFARKYSLPFLLLSDLDHAAAKSYGVWQNRGIFGWGVSRTTFTIDLRGKIRKVFTQVVPEGHGKQVLKAL